MSKTESRKPKVEIGRMGRHLLCSVGMLLLCAMPAGAMTALPLEPTVSAKEAELLAKAAGVGATNAVEAIALLQDMMKSSAAIDFAIGNFQFQANQLTEAAESYRQAIAKQPTFRNARKNLGRVYLLAGEEAKAVSVCQSLVEDGLADHEVFLLLGHGLALTLHWVSAESAYRQALLLDTASDDAQAGLARCLVQQERYLEARSLLRTMLESAPDHRELWSLLANVNVALGAPDAAIRTLETAHRLGCCDAVMLGLLGDLYLNTDRPADAVARYEAALAAGWAESARLLRAVEGLVLMGNAEGAARMLARISDNSEIGTDPAIALEYLRLRSELAALQGDTKEAVESYRQLVRRDPLNGRALLRLGELLRQEGDIGGAELAYERAGRLEGMQAEALVHRAELAVQRDRFDVAVRLLEAAEAVESRPHVARYLAQVRRLAER